jgi:pimeloyl-ACP methyl ester carboxylesterase
MEKVLILHGWGSSAQKWEKIRYFLEQNGIRVFIPDLPGFGGNPAPTNPWTVDDYVNWVKEYIDENNLSEFFLAGHSFGGRIGIKFALKYPEKLKGLILISAAGIRPKETKLFYFKVISALVSIFRKFSFLPGYNFLRRVFYKKILRKADYLKTKGVMKETFKKVIEEDLKDLFSEIKTPTLILWGKIDKTTPLEDAYFMNDKIKGSKLEVLDGLSHLIHLEDPGLLSQKIMSFIK